MKDPKMSKTSLKSASSYRIVKIAVVHRPKMLTCQVVYLSYFLGISNEVGNADKCLRGTLILFIMLMELSMKTQLIIQLTKIYNYKLIGQHLARSEFCVHIRITWRD